MTTLNEQWDYLAWRTMGDSSAFVAIMETNRAVVQDPPETLEAGLTIQIPETPASKSATVTIFE